MKLVLIGAAAAVAAAFITPALARAITEDPGACAAIRSGSNCQNQYRDWQNTNAMAFGETQSADFDAHRYHGGPKSND